MVEQSDVDDRILLSVVCTFPWQSTELPDELKNRGWRLETRLRTGTQFATLGGTTAISAADAGERQQKFATSVESFLAIIADAGVDPAFIVDRNASVSVSVSLCPGTGQAGVVLLAEWLQTFALLNADIAIDAF